jgi:mannose-1-phosphate guanylyltransferase
MILPIILSGGSGTRLWPLSRSQFPKQFLNLINSTSLFQDTLLRLPKESSAPVIICNEEHRFIVAEQLRQIDFNNSGIILEPIGKNTAPAIALSAINLLNKDQDPILLILSTDHIIEDKKLFFEAIDIAKTHAEKGMIVSLGIKPHSPETSYGYIEVNKKDIGNFFEIKSFKEKPNEDLAVEYLNSGNYFWNSGIFLFKASSYIEELSKFEPEIFKICSKACQNIHLDSDFVRVNNKEFIKCPSKSIDHSIMEKTKKGVVVPIESIWSDVGSWNSLWEAKSKDSANNVSEGDVILNKVKNSYIFSKDRLVSVSGVSDLIIIDTQDAILISDKKNSKNVKDLVVKLGKLNRNETVNHRKVYRPWGYFDSVDKGEGFQVKRICVNPGGKLSLQKHEHRAEHWIVVKGIASITCEKKVFKLKENQSTYISRNAIHRLENNQSIPLEIIEVQTGNYIGEDDIIRIEDEYKRK